MAMERNVRTAADLKERLDEAFAELGDGRIGADAVSVDTVRVCHWEHRWLVPVDVAIEAADMIGGNAGERIRAAAMSAQYFEPA